MTRSICHQFIALMAFVFLASASAFGQGCTGTTTLTCTPANGVLTVPANASSSASASITVPATASSIQTVSLTVNKLSGNPFALTLLLVGPGGLGSSQRLVVFDDICGNNNGGDAANVVANLDLALADANATSMPGDAAGCAASLHSQAYKPTVSVTNPTGTMPTPVGNLTAADRAQASGSATFASRFTGNPSGTWTLYAGIVCGPGCGTPTLGSAGGPAFTLTIVLNAAAASTTTTLSSNLNPAFSTTPSNNPTYTATVTSSSTVNAGTVAFQDNGSNIAGCTAVAVNGSGVATCPVTYANTNTEGVHLITASYSGTGSFSTSTSNTLNEVVNNHTTNPVLTTTTAQFCNPGPITLPAAGSVGGPNGTPGSVYPSLITVSGVPSLIQNVQVQLGGFAASNPQAVGYMLQGPNNNTLSFISFAGNTSSVSGLSVNVDDLAANLIPSGSSITSGTWKPTNYTNAGFAQPDSYCQSAVCAGVTVASPAPATIQVAPPSPGGKTLSQQFAGISPNGGWRLFAVERGNPGSGSISNWCLNFTLTAGTPTTTTVTSNQNPAFTGQGAGSVIATATVTPNSGTVNAGTVTFTENGSNLGAPVNVVNNVATLDVTTLGEGSHLITATYSGTATFAPSNGSYTQRMDNASTGSSAGNVFTYCNPGVITLPAGGAASPIAGIAGPYQSKIFANTLPGTTTKVQLQLNNFAFSQPTQLTSLVTTPSGSGLDFFSRVGGVAPVTGLNLLFDDSGVGVGGSLASGTFKPTSASAGNSYPSPAPAGFVYAAPAGAGTLAAFNGTSNAGTWSLWFNTLLNGANGSTNWCLKFTQQLPVVTLTKTHTPTNFLRSSTGTYTLHLANAGPGATGGTVQIIDTLPAGLTPTAAAGPGWNCGLAAQVVTCTRADSLAAGSAFPDVSINVNVLNSIATTTVTNTATASGNFGATSVLTANDVTNVVGNDVSISKTHAGNFTQGQTGATYSITVTNNSAVVTSGPVVVNDNLPAGLTATGFSGSGWNCDVLPALHCTLNADLAANTTSGPITLTVNVAGNASNLTNQATVTYSNQTGANTTANDSTTVLQQPAHINVTGGNNQTTAVTTAFGAPLAVTVTDASSTPVPNVAVTFTAPASGASAVFSNSTNTITVNTNASGVASVPVSANTIVGAYNVTAVAGALNTSFSLTNTAGAASTLTINAGSTPQSTTTGAAFANPLSVTAKDANSNPVSGFSVTFTAPASGASAVFSNATNTIVVVTNASGIAAAPVSANGTAGGPYTVTAAGSGVSTVNFALTNNPGVPTAITTNAGTTPQSTTISTAFPVALSVTAKDASNNPVSGFSVTFTAPASGPSGVFSNATNTITVVTNASGIASAPITANSTAGPQYTVTAAGSGVPTVNFLLTNLTGTPSSMTANGGTTPQTTAVNTAFTNALAVTVKDGGNNPVSGVNVTFTAPGSGASAIFSNSTNTITVATNASGVASAPVTANSTAGGPYNVTAAASGLSTLNFTLTNSPGAASQMTANAGSTPQSTVVNTAFANALAVTVKDASNNPISGFNVTFTAPASGPSAVFSNATNTITVPTNASGVASAPVNANTLAGPQYTVTATGSGVPTVNFQLTNTPGAASSMTANAGTTPQNTAISTAFPNALAVTIKDSFSNPISGINVTFTAPASGASAVFSNATNTITVATNASGVASAPATANTTAGGPYTVTAAASGLTTVNFSLTNNPGTPTQMTTNAGSTPQSTIVNTAFTNALAVTVKDAGNNPVSGFSVTFTAPASGASAVFSNSTNTITVVTNASGIASAPVSANTAAGSYLASASGSGLSSVSFSLTNTPGSPSAMTSNTGTTPQSTPILTAFPVALGVTVKDSFGNPINGFSVTFNTPASGASALFSDSTHTIVVVTNASGIASAVATANSTAGGPYNATAAGSGVPTVNFSLTNVAGAPSQMTPNAGTTPQSTTVNTAFAHALAVTVTDAGNNPVSGFSVTFTAPASGPSAVFSNSTRTITVQTNASGVATAPVNANTIAGVYSVAATGAGVPTVNFALTNLAGPAAVVAASGGSGQSTPVNTTFSSPLIVLVSDAFGNSLSGAQVTWTGPAAGAGIQNSPLVSFTNPYGMASVTVQANGVAGTYTVTAKSGSAVTNFTLTNQ